jgi:hypothetical protein
LTVAGDGALGDLKTIGNLAASETVNKDSMDNTFTKIFTEGSHGVSPFKHQLRISLSFCEPL